MTTSQHKIPYQLRAALHFRDDRNHVKLLEAVFRNDYNEVFKMVKFTRHMGISSVARCQNLEVSMAAMLGRSQILSLFLENKREPNQPDSTDCTCQRRPIHLAASYGSVDCIDILLKKGVEIDSLDSDKRTPLHWASSYGEKNVVEYLLANGATVNKAQQDGFTPLHAATCLGHAAICRILLMNGADVSRADRDNWTALHTAACYGFRDVVCVLLDVGACVHQQTRDAETPFLVACSSGHVDIAEMLYEHGAMINVVNINGCTAFHLAVNNSKYEVVHFLININADMNVANNAGQTPLSLTALYGEKKMLCLMIEAGCRITPEVHSRGLRGDMTDYINNRATSPQSLKQLCRTAIRSFLRISPHDDAQMLPIPTSVKDYILLKHL